MSQKRKTRGMQNIHLNASGKKTNNAQSVTHQNAIMLRSRLRGVSNMSMGSHHHSVELLELPNELLVCVMRYFNAKQLMNLRCVCQKFRDNIDHNSSLWLHASYAGMWPSSSSAAASDDSNKILFSRGASANNKECLIKLALSRLYYFNLNPECVKNKSIMSFNSKLSAKYLLLFDACVYPRKPLTWMLIRPPWSSMKKDIYSYLVKSDKKNNDSLNYTMRRIEMFNNDEYSTTATSTSSESKMFSHYNLSVLLQQKSNSMDRGSKLQWLRKLQDCISTGNMDAHFELVRYIFSTPVEQMLISPERAEESSVALFQRSFNNRVKLDQQQTRRGKEMRSIVVDWLAEVCASKQIAPQMMHAAVHYIDLYLILRTCDRTQLQLLGITCLLVAVKALSELNLHILTIRECSLMTDQTYTYPEVVRMMGEVLAMLRGDVFQPTAWNYLDLLLLFAGSDPCLTHMAHYVLELSLEHTCFANYPPTLLACATLMLVYTIFKETYVMIWPSFLSTFTGYQGHQLVDLACLLHYKCFLTTLFRDGQDQPLSGIRDKYSLEGNMKVAQVVTIPTTSELKERILLFDDMLSPVAEEPLKFVRNTPMDDTFNASVLSTKSYDYDGDCEDCSSASFLSEEDGFALNRSFLSASYKYDFTVDESRDGVDEDAFNEMFQQQVHADDPHSPTLKKFKVAPSEEYEL